MATSVPDFGTILEIDPESYSHVPENASSASAVAEPKRAKALEKEAKPAYATSTAGAVIVASARRSDQMPGHERPARAALQVLLERERLVFVRKTECGYAPHGKLIACVMHRALAMALHTGVQIACATHVIEALRTQQDVYMVRKGHPEQVDRVRLSRAEDRAEGGKRGEARLRDEHRWCGARRVGEAKVEPEGFEPSSKRPQRGLSTCLAVLLVFDPRPGSGTLTWT